MSTATSFRASKIWWWLAAVATWSCCFGPSEAAATDPIISNNPSFNYPWMPGEPIRHVPPDGIVTVTIPVIGTPSAPGTALFTQVTRDGRNLVLILVQEKFAETPKLIAEKFPQVAKSENAPRNSLPTKKRSPKRWTI